jgi:hypothetical protein
VGLASGVGLGGSCRVGFRCDRVRCDRVTVLRYAWPMLRGFICLARLAHGPVRELAGASLF